MQRRSIDNQLNLEIAAIDVAICWVDADLAAEIAALDAEYAAEAAAMSQPVESAPVAPAARPTPAIELGSTNSAIKYANQLSNLSIKGEKAFVEAAKSLCEVILANVKRTENMGAQNMLLLGAKAVVEAQKSPAKAAAIRATMKKIAAPAMRTLLDCGADLDLVIPVANALSSQIDAALALIADSHDWYRSGMTNTENLENNEIARRDGAKIVSDVRFSGFRNARR